MTGEFRECPFCDEYLSRYVLGYVRDGDLYHVTGKEVCCEVHRLECIFCGCRTKFYYNSRRLAFDALNRRADDEQIR